MFKATLSAASSVYNLATTTAVAGPIPFTTGNNAPTGSTSLGDQVVAVDVVSSDTGAAATIALILVDPNEATDTKVRIFEASVTVTLLRANDAGDGGGYVCTVTFNATGTNKIDLLGSGYRPRTLSGAGAVGDVAYLPLRWYIGNGAAGGLGTLTVRIHPTRAN